MNFFNIWAEWADTLRTEVIKKVTDANFDKTFKAKVIGKVSEGKYQIFYRGQKHVAASTTALSTNQIVRVCAPQNNWDELFILASSNSGGGGSTVAGVSGVKGSAESSYRDGDVNITAANIGLGNVENKSSATIRSEITSGNVTNALGYTPLNASGADYEDLVTKKHTHSNQSLLDAITQALIDGWNAACAHISDTIKHISATERTNWNKAYNHTTDNEKHITSSERDSLDNLSNHLSNTNNPHKVTKTQIGLGNVDNIADANKSVLNATKLKTARKINDVLFDGTEDIRVTDPVIQVTKAEYDSMLNAGTLDEQAYYLVTDDEANNLVNNVSGYFTLAMEGWDLVAYYPDEADPPALSIEETGDGGWNVFYTIPE